MEVWDEIVLELNKELEKVKEVISEGGPSNFAEYQNLVGYCKGIITNRNHGIDNEED
mgnify:CR=1 FL=1